MQTLSLQVHESYMKTFINYVEEHSSNIVITKDNNLECDPYFYERQKELHQIKNDIDHGKIEMVSHEQVWGNIKNHLKTIEN